MEHPNLVAALAAFHAEAPKVIKDATAKVTGESKDGSRVSYSYGYADLSTVTEALNPLLGKHGLAFTSKPTLTEQGFGLVYALKHESGEADEGFWPLPDPTRVKPQDLGSWITYWRRYAFLASTNTFPSGEDDDGAKAQAQPRESWDNAQPRQQARQEKPAPAPAPAAAKKEWTDDEVLDQIGRLSTLDLAKAGKLYDWMAARDLHHRVVQEVTGTQALAFRLADDVTLASPGVAEIDTIRDFAAGRGLLKVAVSESETLDQVLVEGRARAVRNAEAAEKAMAATETALAAAGGAPLDDRPVSVE
jgi:hypothetical protein